jgi:endonuclease/exonuclease/phosphatase (EEP) superfamily protein YafD
MDSGRLRDAATELGIDKPTWTMDGRPFIQATIDHILFSSGTARSYLLFPIAGSDHQAVLATIRF